MACNYRGGVYECLYTCACALTVKVSRTRKIAINNFFLICRFELTIIWVIEGEARLRLSKGSCIL